MKGRINIAVTGTGSLIGQAVIKSVQRSDLKEQVKFMGFDYFSNTVGSFWCSRNYLLPDILKAGVSEQDWLNVLIDRIIGNAVKLLFVGVDFELPLIAKYRSYIEEQTGVIVLVSSEEVISIANDKYLTSQFLKKHKLPHPESFLPGSVSYSALKYPVIVKPRKGARSVGVSTVTSQEQLIVAIRNLKEPVIQECVGTEETEFTCGVICLNGELKQPIVLRRSLKGGNTYLSYYKRDFPQIITEYLNEVTRHLRPFGPCNYQLRLDHNGTPKIFEINARHSGTTYIRSLFGYKEVEYIINFLMFNKEMQFNLREGTVVRYYEEFFVEQN